MFTVLKHLKNKLNKENGMEMLQVLLIAGIVLVLIVVVFYPAVQKFFEAMLKVITDWFTNKGSVPFK